MDIHDLDLRKAAVLVASLDPEKMDGQKYRAAEFKKQIDQGAVLPWPEVFTVNRPLTKKEIAKRKENDPNFSGRVLTPKVLGGEEVLLCWRLGEANIAFYHSRDGGYMGRKPIQDKDGQANQ